VNVVRTRFAGFAFDPTERGSNLVPARFEGLVRYK